jgi:hypothetical protein
MTDIRFATLADYSRALDEIFNLRRAFALEAGYLVVTLTMKTFPKSRRRFSEDQVINMRTYAQGLGGPLFASMDRFSLRHAQEEAGTVNGPTVESWLLEEHNTRTLQSQVSTAIPVELLERAVREIRMLRTTAARFSRLLGIPTDYASFPKTRRSITEDQMARLDKAAAGRVQLAYAGFDSEELYRALPSAGANAGLTRDQYEAEAHRA